MNSGIYLIRNVSSGKVYVGSTKDFTRRFKTHKYSLARGTHHSAKLQRAWLKYGAAQFAFEKVLLCSVKNLLLYEQIVIDYYNAAKLGYNQLVTAGSRQDTPHNIEVVAKMRAFQRANRTKYAWGVEQLCIAEIAERVGLPRDLLWRRVVSDKIPLAEAVSTPYKKPGQPIAGMGLVMTFPKWVQKIGCTTSFLRLWLKKGLTIEECIAKHKAITQSEFARVAGVDPNSFLQRLRLGWGVGDALATPVRKTLTRADAADIRELAKEMSIRAIAKKYNVHSDTIGLIVRNVSFSEISMAEEEK